MARRRNSTAPAERTKKSISRAAVVQPSTRTYQTWTPARIRAVEVSADSGNLREVARLCEWLLGDEEIQGALNTRVQALLGLNPTFAPVGDKRRSARVIRTLQDSDWWPSYPENELAQIHTWGLLAGYCPGRHQWISPEANAGRLLPNPEFWHPQHLRFDWDSRRWVVRVVPDDGKNSKASAGVEEDLIPGDGSWLLHTPYGVTRPWSMGLWRGLARWALLKAYAVSDLGRLGESVTRNVVESEKTIESTKELRQELADDISAMARDSTIVLPEGFTYKLIETSASTPDLFELQIKLANTAFAIAIRGGNLTTNTGESGSRAAAEVQERVGDQAKLRFDAQSLSTFIHDQSLVWWAEFNFGSSALAPWPKYPVDPKENLVDKAEGMDKAADAAQKWVSLGYELDREAFAETFDVAGFLKPTPGEPPKPVVPGEESEEDGDGDGADDSDDDQPDDEDDDTGADSSDSKVRAQGPNAIPRTILASGDNPNSNTGFISGQLYADALVDAATDMSQALLERDRAGIRRALANATDYESLRENLRSEFAEMQPETLMALTEQLLNVAHFAGRAAVNQDS